MRLSGTKATAIHQYRGLGNQLWDLAGNRPSLDLRFADNKSLVDATTGTNLVDFTRASSGTYVGSDGLIKTATTNLLLRSEEFETTWGGINQTVAPNVAVAPNGSITADKLQFDSGIVGSSCQILQDISSGINANTAYSMSVYLKADDASLARIIFNCRNPSFLGQVSYQFNLATGNTELIGTNGTAPTNHSASAVSIGNGWYRCRVTATTPATTNVARFLIAGDGADTGTGTNGFFMWGAQLEQSSTVGEYIPTTSTINSAPRFDHDPTTGECLGLLVEEQRSNLLLNSGTLSTQDVTVTAEAHTLSFTGTGTITLSGASTAGPLVGTGTGEANRASLTFTPTAGTLTLTVSGTVSNAQLEIGSFRSSYIPTEGSAVTRAADVPTDTTRGAAIRSLYAQFRNPASGTRPVVSLDDDTANERIELLTSGTDPKLLVTDGGSAQADLDAGSITANTTARLAARFNTDNFAASVSGGAEVTDTTGTMPTVDRIRIGRDQAGNCLNGTIARITGWDSPLPLLPTITQ